MMSFRSLAGLGLFASAGLLTARAAVPASKPNIVVILSDDQGWHDVGYHGAEIATPNIDRLAASGVKLEQFYAQPVCTPTRAALLTGRYPMRLGLQLGVIKPDSRHGLPLNVPTLPQLLAASGYYTAMAGKWHLGNGGREYLPTSRGFDHQYGFYLGMTDYFTHIRDGGLDWHRNDHALREPGYATDLIAAEAVRTIEEHHGDMPLFLYVAFNAPHTPLEAPESYLNRYQHIAEKKRRTYAAMVTCMDDGIGRIIDALDRKHLRENTLLVFASDNGGNLPAASNQPFRDQKGSVYEGGVHVLALANWPGHLPKGTTVDQPLHMTDWFVTLLKVAGAALPADAGALDGRDLWPALNGNRAPVHEDILINAAPGSGALRRGDWKLVVNGQLRYKAGTPAPGFSWADLLEETGLPRELASRNQVELFNLAQDPGEAHDLAAAKPDLTRELKARYDAYEKEAVPLVGSEVVKDFKAPPVWGEFPDKEKD